MSFVTENAGFASRYFRQPTRGSVAVRRKRHSLAKEVGTPRAAIKAFVVKSTKRTQRLRWRQEMSELNAVVAVYGTLIEAEGVPKCVDS